MSETWLLMSPLARRAYFNQATDVARAELKSTIGVEARHESHGNLDFLVPDRPVAADTAMARVSFIQALFEADQNPLQLTPLSLDPMWHLPEAFTHGVSYAGKTNEMVTQLALNLALAHCQLRDGETHLLLDPMAGQGTSLLWAARYGISSVGIETRKECLDRLHAHVRKQCKLTRTPHKAQTGFAGGKRHSNPFRQVDFNDTSLRLINGDAREANKLHKKRFSLLVTDLPYGIAHRSSDGDSNPAKLVSEAAPAWADGIKTGGALALIFNRYQPKPAALKQALADAGFQVVDTTTAHRMSESIERDVMVAVKPR
jgi:hypothetical protein